MGEFFINRPIVAMVISIVTVLLGFVALSGLPVAQYPEITPPEIVISATYTGADAVTVEQSVATPLEQQLNGVENSIYMKSVNASDGTTQVRVAFEVGTDLDIANVLVQNRVAQAQPFLPEEVKRLGVTVKKSLSFPLMLVALRSPGGSFDNNFLSNYAAINVNGQIARINGVGQVNLFGGSDYAMRIWVRPDQLAKLQLTVPDLINAVQQQNAVVPAGQVGGQPAPPGTDMTYTVGTRGRLSTPEEFGEVVIRANPDGSLLRLKDVARIELGSQLYSMVGRLDGAPAAVIAIYQQPGSNALAVADQIRATMAELSADFPADIEYQVSLDTTLAVREGISEIISTLFEAVVLVILVVFVFLQNWRATLIPLLTVPVSLVGAFIVFPLLGFSVNVLSLLGLVLAIGIVVDDAIVVVEAVMHHIEQGMSPRDATRQAMKEVSGPVIAIALILAAVFVPVAFVPGITGLLYQQFAITIAISVAFSAFNALTLSPALAALLLKPAGGKPGPLAPFYAAFNRVFGRITDGYAGLTGRLARRPLVGVALVAAIAAAAVLLALRLPTGFVPDEDQGYLLVNAQLPDAASLQRTDAVVRQIEAVLAATPGVKSHTSVVGYSLLSSAAASNNAFVFVELEEWAERPAGASAAELVGRLNRQFAGLPEAVVFAFGPPPIPGLGSGSGFSLMLQDRGGNDPAWLQAQVQNFLQATAQRPEIGNAFTTFSAAVPTVYVDIDREKVLKQGVQLKDVNTSLGANLGGAYVNDFNRFGRLYKVYVQAEPEYRVQPEDIGQFFVRNADGGMVPISTLVGIGRSTGPTFTNRFNLYRAVEVTGSPAPGYSSGDARRALEATAREVLPADMGFAWNAVSFQEQRAEGSSTVVLVFALVMVFLILAAQYESWTLPMSVVLGTPFAAFGAFLGLWLARFLSPVYVNNVFAQIGLVLLIGLAAKNAILIVEFARMKFAEGMDVVDAAIEAARLRFRPILMTAFAFILGVVPLVIASGAGAYGRRVMGLAVFSGMLVATAIGVLLVPALFVLVERFGGRRHAADAPPAGPAPGAGGGH
jgi:HAE1 family hydrophobic/amphiphilic exporter-1